MKKNLILLLLVFSGIIAIAQGGKLPPKFTFIYPFDDSRQKIFLRVSYYPAYKGGAYTGPDYAEFVEAVVVKNTTVIFVPFKGLDVSGDVQTVKKNIAKGIKYLIGVEMKNEMTGEYSNMGTLDMAGTFFLYLNGAELYPPELIGEATPKSIDIDLPAPVVGKVYLSGDQVEAPKGIPDVGTEVTGSSYETRYNKVPDDARYDPLLNTNEPLITAKDVKGKKSITLPLNLNNWKAVHFNPDLSGNPATFRGEFSPENYTCVESGLKVNATTYRMGAWLIHRSQINYANKEVYLKWKLNAQYDFSDIHAMIYTGNEKVEPFMKQIKMLSYLSTRNQWDESVMIPYTNDWFYTRLVFTGNSCTSYTSTSNYDNKGGKLIQTFTKPVPNTTGRIGLGFGDVYSGNSAYFILGEALIQSK